MLYTLNIHSAVRHLNKTEKNKQQKKTNYTFISSMGTPDYKETAQDYALAVSAWWSKLCHQSLHSNQTRQDYCSFITELTLSSADKTTRQSTRGMRIEINTRPLCQLPHALASKLPSSMQLPVLLAFPPLPTELASPDNKSTPDLSTDPIGSSTCIISFCVLWLNQNFKLKTLLSPWYQVQN